jgi:DNA-directed RNA polymerase subunit RPC12/RpoP
MDQPDVMSSELTDVNEYKCPNCGAPLSYNPETGQMSCESCDSSFSMEEVSMAARNLHKVEGFDWSGYKNETSHETMHTAVYTCQSCGATIEADASTAATKCPYCDNNVVMNERVQGGIRPNAVIPFRYKSKDLPGLVKKFYQGKKLLPNNFFNDSYLTDVQGLYVPFWLFDCGVEGGVNLQGERVISYSEGDYDVTETSYYMLERDGSMHFSHIPVDASTKMSNDLMDSVEPFDFSELADFQEGYLSGFLADRFDSDPDAELPRASARLMRSAEETLKGTCHGYTGVHITSNAMQISDASVKYALLPIYLLNCNYKGEKYQYAVNGQTGKVVGRLPIDKGKATRWFLGAFAVGTAVCYLLLNLFL